MSGAVFAARPEGRARGIMDCGAYVVRGPQGERFPVRSGECGDSAGCRGRRNGKCGVLLGELGVARVGFSPMAIKRVVVVILNWNGGDLTLRCIESLRQSHYPDLQVLVVDNGSTDGSLEEIVKACPEAGIIKNPRNLGFAEGCNQGIAWGLYRGADYVMVLNNDTWMDPHMISNLVAAATAHDDRAAVIPKIYFASDPSRLWFAGGRVNLWTGVFSNTAHNLLDDGRFKFPREMEYAVGCCILVSKRIVQEVGGFDSSYFAYFEDVDWSLRCRRAGFPLVLCPSAKLWHVVSAAGKRRPANIRYLMTRNHLWTMRRHASPGQLACALLLLPLRSLWRIAKSSLAREWESIPAEFRGLKDGLLTRPPKGEYRSALIHPSNAGL